MASIPRDQAPTSSVEDAGCANRVLINTAVGFGVGLAGAVVALVFRAPSASPKLNSAHVFRNICYEVLPMTTGGAAVYTAVSCSVESNRGHRDWINPAAGGAATGALVLGLKKRSLVAAGIGAGIFAVGAASPEFNAMMSSTPAEDRKREVALSAQVPEAGPRGGVFAYARSAATTQNYTNKLQ